MREKYTTRIRKISKIDRGTYLSQSYSVDRYFTLKILKWFFIAIFFICFFPFTIPYAIIGLFTKNKVVRITISIVIGLVFLYIIYPLI